MIIRENTPKSPKGDFTALQLAQSQSLKPPIFRGLGVILRIVIYWLKNNFEFLFLEYIEKSVETRLIGKGDVSAPQSGLTPTLLRST
jgi:hypothetical protein